MHFICPSTLIGSATSLKRKCVSVRIRGWVPTKESTMKKVIEIRAAEGGEDSKLFTKDLAQAYQRHFDRLG